MIEKAITIKPFIVDLRRAIHQHPELGYQEQHTAQLVAKQLRDLDVPFKEGIAKTGLLAELRMSAGPTVLVRADMDALPIQEETGLPFQSQISGVMHACGHDTHTAMLLGAIKLLKAESFNGTLRFMFQPAEEGNYDDPQGLSGAQRMIIEGALEGVDAAIGLHQLPTMKSGTIGIPNGGVMAAADFFEINVKGKSAHAGVCPEAGIDAVLIASELVVSLQSIVSRQIGPKETAVISVSTIEGGSAANILADKVRMTGTLRAMSVAVHEKLLELIHQRCESFAKLYATDIDFNVYYGVPVTENDKHIAQISRQSAVKVFGQNNVYENISIMGGEDFGNIAQKVPSSFALLGTQVEKGEVFPLHSPKMQVNEDALPYGSAYLAQTALDLLQHLKK